MTVEADIKALLVAANLPGVTTRVYRDLAPDSEPLPYVTFSAEVSEVPATQGDGRTQWARRLVQVDVWQDRAAESDTLPDAVTAVLDGHKLATAGRTRLYVTARQRLVETDVGIVHHALTVSVNRER